MIKIKESEYDVKIGRTEIIVPHEDKPVTLISPAVGPNTYQNVGKQILSDGLNLPIEENASLVHAAYCGPEDFRNQGPVGKVRDIMKNRWLWTFKQVLWTPEGMYAVSDPQAKGRNGRLEVRDLEKALRGGKELEWGGIRLSADGRVSFAPKDSYQLGEHTSEELAKQGDVVAVYGKSGAEKLGEVASIFQGRPKTFGVSVKEGQESVKRLSALGADWGGRRLGVGGDGFGDGRYGVAFRVVK